MKIRALAIATMLPLAALVACDNDNDGTGPNTTAIVRFVNATDANLDVATNGTPGNGRLSFGGSTACMTVNTGSTLSVVNAGTNTPLPGFTPTFTPGGNYTVIAYPGANGVTQFATLGTTFTPASGQAGLRVFNAAAGASSVDSYVTAPGASLGTASATATAFGTSSAWFNLPSGSRMLQLTPAGTQTVGASVATTFVAGESSTLVLAPAAAGTAALRVFFAGGC